MYLQYLQWLKILLWVVQARHIYIVALIGIDCGFHFWEHKGNTCGFQIEKLSTTKATITYAVLKSVSVHIYLMCKLIRIHM